MKLKWYHRVRLIRLADKLEGKGPYAAVGPVPAHKFDMLYLAQEFRGGEVMFYDDFNPLECNTAACALGWALSDPWFKADGGKRMEFGLNSLEYHWLFHAESYASRLVTPSVVAASLREVAVRP